MLIILDNGGILARRRERKPRGYNYRIRKDTEEVNKNIGDKTTKLERIQKKRTKT